MLSKIWTQIKKYRSCSGANTCQRRYVLLWTFVPDVKGVLSVVYWALANSNVNPSAGGWLQLSAEK